MLKSKLIIKGITNPYRFHKILWEAMGNKNESKRPFLFRTTQEDDIDGVVIICQADRIPSAVPGMEVVETYGEAYPSNIEAGDIMRFRVVANPIKCKPDESGRLNKKNEVKKVRIPLVGRKDLEEWIGRKLSEAAEIDKLYINALPPLHFMKKGMVGKIQRVAYYGTLVVRNPEALRKLLDDGVGPEKAFGCGMLEVAHCMEPAA